MEPMSSIDSSSAMSDVDKQTLLTAAEDSIKLGAEKGLRLDVDEANYSEALREKRSTFVTIHKNGKLRGCVGSMIATRPLIVDVAQSAYAAAFKDHRFQPITTDELTSLTIDISVLSPMEPIVGSTEEDILKQIRPNIDGLYISDGAYSSTFLPVVWENLPDKEEFMAELKKKAGLSENYWSENMKVQRYTTLKICG